jgi:hypothetical protein
MIYERTTAETGLFMWQKAEGRRQKGKDGNFR